MTSISLLYVAIQPHAALVVRRTHTLAYAVLAYAGRAQRSSANCIAYEQGCHAGRAQASRRLLSGYD